MERKPHNPTFNIFDRLKMTESTFMLLTAALIGVLAGLGAVAFKKIIHGFESLSSLVPQAEFLRIDIFALFVFMILMSRFLSNWLTPNSGHGVAEIIEAVTTRGGKIKARLGVVKTFLSALTIGVGGSCGAEGPIALFGASTGSKLGQKFKVNADRLKIFAASGAAAGIAATFNSPLGGFMFAIEIILMDFGLTKVAPIVVSTIIASATANHWLKGQYVLELGKTYQMTGDFWLLGCLFLGVGIGLISVLYILILDKCEQFFKWPVISRLGWGSAILAGIVFTALVMAFSEVKGVGSSTMGQLFSGDLQMAWYLLLLILVAKILATGVTLGAGGNGGIFFPGLFVGALGGIAIGQLLKEGIPGIFGDSDPIVYGILGMGAMVSGAMRAPMTGILMTYELNNAANYNLILPLMFVCVISTVISRQFFPHSIFTLKLSRQGTLVSKGRDIEISRTVKVEDCFEDNYYSVTPDMTLQALFHLSQTAYNHTNFFVCEEGKLLGLIPIHRVRINYAKVQDMATQILAQDIMKSVKSTLNLEDTLERALKYFDRRQLDELPVTDEGLMKGVLTSADALDAYNQALQRLHAAQQIAETMQSSDGGQRFELGDDLVLVEIPVPQPFVGKMVKELELPKYHNVHLLMLKSLQNKKSQVIHAQTQLEEDQILVLMGPRDDVDKISRL